MDERAGEATSKGEPALENAKAEPARKLFRAQTLVALAVCGGALIWSYRTAMEGMNPTTRLAKLLRSGDVDDRRLAARQLGGSDQEEVVIAIPALVEALGDNEELVRAEVASGLGGAGVTAMKAEGKQAQARQAAQALTRALSDAGTEVRMSAALALGVFAGQPTLQDFPADPAAVSSAMVGLLDDPSSSVRSSAETALARIASKSPIEPPSALVEGLKAWPSKESRKAAAFALGSFKGNVGPTVAALTRALEDKEPEVRSDAALSLRRFGLDAVPAVPSLVKNLGDPFLPPPAPASLSVMSTSRVGGGPGVGGAIAPEPTDPAVQAAKAIGRIVAAQVEKGDSPPAGVVEALTNSLKSDRKELKDAVEEALRRIGKGASAAIPTLIRGLADSSPKPGPGPTSAGLLGDIAPGTERAGEAITALASALDSNDPVTRMAAVKGLAKFGPAASSALPRLREIGEDKNAGADSASEVKLATDRIEGKVPPESPRRKGQGRRGRGGPTRF